MDDTDSHGSTAVVTKPPPATVGNRDHRTKDEVERPRGLRSL